jgi:hypothetical protein
VSQGALWFSLLGGPFAWLAHLLAIYSISEWGCVDHFPAFRALGTVGTAWELLIATSVLLLAALSAAWVGYRSEQRLRARGRPLREQVKSRRADFYAARAGMILSGFFAFVILVEAIPTYFFLHVC